MGPGPVIKKANGAVKTVLAKPFVVMAARMLGPGPLRLRMVKLAHNLDSDVVVLEPKSAVYENAPAQPTSRAA